jgi:hypothetical protein
MLSACLLVACSQAIGDWKVNVAALHAASNGHALVLLAPMIFRAHGLLDACDIALPIFNTFLCEIEAR